MTASHWPEYTAKVIATSQGRAGTRSCAGAPARSGCRPGCAREAKRERLHHRASHDRGQRGDAPPPATPAQVLDPYRPGEQAERSAKRHVCAPEANHRVDAVRCHEAAQQRGRRQHDEQKSESLDRTRREQQFRSASQPAGGAGERQDRQAENDASSQADAVGPCAERDAGGHAGELHQRQQEAGLHERHVECFLQRTDGRRQLPHVQRSADAGRDHDQWRRQAFVRDALGSSHSCLLI